jgi:hypothetical protein
MSNFTSALTAEAGQFCPPKCLDSQYGESLVVLGYIFLFMVPLFLVPLMTVQRNHYRDWKCHLITLSRMRPEMQQRKIREWCREAWIEYPPPGMLYRDEDSGSERGDELWEGESWYWSEEG